MKAWIVSDRNGEDGSVIVFAETRGKAKVIAKWDDTFDCCDWTDLRARRFPDFDKYYNGKDQIFDFWHNDEMRLILVRDFGWSCVEPDISFCEDCNASQYCDYARMVLNA